MHASLRDPWTAAQIEEALAPYVDHLAPSELAWMRDQLAEALVEDPEGRALLQHARPHAIDQSGEVRCTPFEEPEEAPPAKKTLRRRAG